MTTLEATAVNIIRGYGLYNPGEKAVFSDEDAASLLREFPNGWRRCHREDAEVKAPTAPPSHKMVKKPEQKK
jgi:hypothetical protein